MVTRDEMIAELRTWIGTPVRHQGQRKGVAVDCKGLAVGVGLALRMPEVEGLAASARNYSKGFKGRALLDGLRDSLIRVPEPQPADLLAILWGREPMPRHLAFWTRPGWIIHAYGGAGFVAEVPLSHMRVHSVWSWPSLGAPAGGC
jgi:NlpC/P60 family putative phage cell wall peptidase